MTFIENKLIERKVRQQQINLNRLKVSTDRKLSYEDKIAFVDFKIESDQKFLEYSSENVNIWK